MSIPHYSNEPFFKIALIQPASWGDNINSTLMFKPLKKKFPDSIIDVYTAQNYSSAFANNPYVHKIIEFPAANKEKALNLLHVIPPLVKNRGYDRVYCPHPMINGDKWTSVKHGSLGTNLINAWVRALEESDVDYELPLETVMVLTQHEVQRVDDFCNRHNSPAKRNFLMEVEGLSGQTFWNSEWTVEVGKHLLRGDTKLFLSRQNAGADVQALHNIAPEHVHFAGELTIRECAELFNRCDGFFSVSSGLSNACNTNWCKKDKLWIETVNSDAVSSAPIRSEGKTFWTDNHVGRFIDMLKSRGI